MASRYRIHPGYGVGAYVLGATREIVLTLQDDPEDVDREVDEDGSEHWELELGLVEIRFDADDDGRASWITVSHPDAEIAGLRPIGLPLAKLQEKLRSAGLGPLLLTDEFGDGMSDHEWAGGSLSFWISHGIVESVTVMPFYDPTGEIPLWPLDAARS
ncbi:MAG: hypothetical protein O3C51_16930 [Planctomycetota bacterium]|nr:hypothetical protein [Planctomycetota bacterium]